MGIVLETLFFTIWIIWGIVFFISEENENKEDE